MPDAPEVPQEEKKTKKKKDESSLKPGDTVEKVISEADKALEKAAAAAEKLKRMNKKIRDEDLVRMKTLLGIKEGITYADEYESVKEVFTTGYPELDRVLTTDHFEKYDIGGIPRGYLVEMYGPFGGGKSSLCLAIAGGVTRKGEKVLWADVESSYQPSWAAAQGVDNSKMLRLGPSACENGEKWLELVEKAAKSGEFALIVVDSLAGLQPKVIIECAVDKNAQMGAAGQMTSKAMPKIVRAAEAGHCSVIFVNQIRDKIGVMYGSPEDTPGGKALKFFASLRIRVAPIGGKRKMITVEGDSIGVRSNVQNTKGRFGPPMQETVLPIYFQPGQKPHPLDQLIDLAMAKKVIKCKTDDGKQFFNYGETKRIEGMDPLMDLFSEGAAILTLAEKVKEAGGAMSVEVVEYLKTLDGNTKVSWDPRKKSEPDSDEL